jgi:hypothetical protein
MGLKGYRDPVGFLLLVEARPRARRGVFWALQSNGFHRLQRVGFDPMKNPADPSRGDLALPAPTSEGAWQGRWLGCCSTSVPVYSTGTLRGPSLCLQWILASSRCLDNRVGLTWTSLGQPWQPRGQPHGLIGENRQAAAKPLYWRFKRLLPDERSLQGGLKIEDFSGITANQTTASPA